MLGVVTKVDFGQIGGFKPGDRLEHLQQQAGQALQIRAPVTCSDNACNILSMHTSLLACLFLKR